jgi:hypothetical protein
MKINFNTSSSVEYMDVEVGQTFIMDGVVYMKVINEDDFEDDSEFLAISLNNGKVNHLIDDTDHVVIVETELNVVNMPF